MTKHYDFATASIGEMVEQAQRRIDAGDVLPMRRGDMITYLELADYDGEVKDIIAASVPAHSEYQKGYAVSILHALEEAGLRIYRECK